VLAVGCGVGAYGRVAIKHGTNYVVGLDIDREYLSKAKFIESVQASENTPPLQEFIL